MKRTAALDQDNLLSVAAKTRRAKKMRDMKERASSSTSSSSSEIDETDEKVQLDEFMGIYFDKIPFICEPGFDCFVLDKEEQNSDSSDDSEVENMSLFTRNLKSYPRFSIVRKCYGPWGNGSILRNKRFILVNRIFRSDGEVIYIQLRTDDSEQTSLLVDPRFFTDWMDNAAQKTYEQFKSQCTTL